MRPPALARALLAWTLPPRAREAVVGDMDEEFAHLARVRGEPFARAWYRRMALASWLACWSAGWRSGTRRSGASGRAPGARRARRPGPSFGPRAVLDGLRFSFVHAGRSLRRSPGFTAMVVVTLALAIGANTAVFSIANATLLRPVPGMTDSNALFEVYFQKPDGNGTGTSWANVGDLTAAVDDLADLMTSTSGSYDVRPQTGAPVSVRGESVPTGYFDFLGVRPAVGRLPADEAVDPGATERWVVISEALWTSLYGRDPGVVGQPVQVNGQTFTLVGVTDGYRGAQRAGNSDVFFPFAHYPQLRYPGESYSTSDRSWRPFFELIARPVDGVDAEALQSRLREAMARIVAAHPEDAEIHAYYIPTVYEGVGTPYWQRAPTAQALGVLGLIVAMVLLIACANVAGLLVARGVARRGDSAVRRAIGASRGRIVLEHVSEGLLLSLPAASLGLVAAHGLTSALGRLPGGSGLVTQTPPLDLRVIAFTAAVAVVAAVGFSLLPALLAHRVDVRASLIHASTRHSGGGARLLRSGLTVAQVALSLVLLIGASLLVRTLGALQATELGFDANGVSVLSIDPGHQGYDVEAAALLYDQLRRDLDARPEIRVMGLSHLRPFGGSLFSTRLRTEEQTNEQAIQPYVQWIGPGYFEALGQTVTLGRSFSEAEQNLAAKATETAALMNETLARRMFGEPSAALGRRVIQPLYEGDQASTVVGVVSDARMRSLREPEPILYLPFAARGRESATVVLKSNVDHATTVRLVQESLARLDGGIPVSGAQRLDDLVRRASAEERLFATLLTIMAVLAGTLAAVGLYGVVAYAVAQRRAEFGIRLALGADARRLVRGVLRQGAWLGLFGILLGWVGAAGFTRLLASRLYGVEPLDPVVFLGAAAAFFAVTVLASAGPARTTTRIDPVEALREE